MDENLPPLIEEPVAQPTIVTSKKRPHEGNVSVPSKKPCLDAEYTEMRKKAQLFCKSKDDWKLVSKFNKKRLEEYLEDQSYLDSAELVKSTSTFVLRAYAMIMDKIYKGEGHVEEELTNDLTLQSAIERELIAFAKFINNKMAIGIFTCSDIVNAKKKQAEVAKHSPVIVDVSETAYSACDEPQNNSDDIE